MPLEFFASVLLEFFASVLLMCGNWPRDGQSLDSDVLKSYLVRIDVAVRLLTPTPFESSSLM